MPTAAPPATPQTPSPIRRLCRRRVWTNFRHRSPEVPPAKVAMLSTAVSSKALAAMAEAEGFK